MPPYISAMEKYLSIEADGSLTDAQWENYWRLMNEIQLVKNEPSVFETWQELKRSRTEIHDETNLTETIIASGDEMLGRVRIRRRSADFIEAEIETKLAEPSTSLMMYAAGLILKTMNELSLEKVNYKTSNAALSNFSKKIGAKLVNHFFYYQLEYANANTEEIDKWLRDMPSRSPKAELKIYKGVPAEHLDEYADIFIELLDDMPRDASLPPQAGYTAEDIKRDLRSDANGGRQLWTGILFEEGRMLGMTNLAIHNNNFEHVFQFMTGVKKENRGRGLARWLKAAMFRHLSTFDTKPKMIYTSTYSLNMPMQNINFAMGYELKKEGFEYMLLREELKNELQKTSVIS